MLDKSKLGTRYTCFECGTKFYDLNRPEPMCPECGADQRDAPRTDIRALLGKGRKRASSKAAEEEDDDDKLAAKGDDDDDDDDLGLLDDDDDDDGDDGDDDDE